MWQTGISKADHFVHQFIFCVKCTTTSSLRCACCCHLDLNPLPKTSLHKFEDNLALLGLPFEKELNPKGDNGKSAFVWQVPVTTVNEGYLNALEYLTFLDA